VKKKIVKEYESHIIDGVEVMTMPQLSKATKMSVSALASRLYRGDFEKFPLDTKLVLIVVDNKVKSLFK